MATKEVRYTDDEYSVVITVRRASFDDGLTRVLLSRQVVENLDEDFAEEGTPEGVLAGLAGMRSIARGITVASMYPACMCVTVTIDNHPDAVKPLSLNMTSFEFMKLPEDLVSAWLNAVYDLNPKWQMERDEPAALGEASEPVDNSSLTPVSSPGSELKNEAEVA